MKVVVSSMFPTMTYPMKFGEKYKIKNNFDDVVECLTIDNGSCIRSTTTGGQAGTLTTLMEIVQGQLLLTTQLEDKSDSTAVRILERV